MLRRMFQEGSRFEPRRILGGLNLFMEQCASFCSGESNSFLARAAVGKSPRAANASSIFSFPKAEKLSPNEDKLELVVRHYFLGPFPVVFCSMLMACSDFVGAYVRIADSIPHNL